MENVVIITKNPKTGNVFTPNAKLGKDGVQYGYIRVEKTDLHLTGFARVQRRSALIPISEKDYNAYANQLAEGKKLSGKIVYMDSLVPMDGYKSMDIVNRETGEVKSVTSNGKVVYRKTMFTEDINACDTKVVYDKVAVDAPMSVAEPVALA